MYKVAIIPARGGSKRIPRKNIKPFCGKPIIGYSIEAAISCGLFDKIIVSTDDPEIADVAKTFGAEIPFMRPSELADDYTGTVEVINHSIIALTRMGITPDYVCCIYATAPLITSADLDEAWKMLLISGAQYAFPVTKYKSPIQRALRVNDNNRLGMLNPENYSKRSQDLEPCFHDAGQFYWGQAEAFMNKVPLFSSSSVGLFLPPYRVQDIDDLDDWFLAELLYRALQTDWNKKILDL